MKVLHPSLAHSSDGLTSVLSISTYTRYLGQHALALKVFLVGDFNFPNFDWVNQVPLLFDQLHIKMFELLNDLFLIQMNQHATRNNNMLDLVFTSTPDLVNDVSASEGVVDTDHRSVTFTIDLNLNRVNPRPKFVLDFKKANLRELNSHFAIYSLEFLTTGQ